MRDVHHSRGVEDAGVIDENLDPPECFLNGLDHVSDIFRICHVSWDGQRVDAIPFPYVRSDFLKGFRVEIVDSNLRPSEPDGRRWPHPCRAARVTGATLFVNFILYLPRFNLYQHSVVRATRATAFLWSRARTR